MPAVQSGVLDPQSEAAALASALVEIGGALPVGLGLEVGVAGRIDEIETDVLSHITRAGHDDRVTSRP